MDATSTASTTEKISIMDLPTIPLDQTLHDVECHLCGHSAWDPSPFADASPEDCYQGLRPWQRYRLSLCKQFKIPRDKDCRVCYVVFNGSSFKAKHGTTKKYHQHVTNKPDEHRLFKGGVKRLISNVNDAGDSSLETLRKVAKSTKPVESVT